MAVDDTALERLRDDALADLKSKITLVAEGVVTLTERLAGTRLLSTPERG